MSQKTTVARNFSLLTKSSLLESWILPYLRIYIRSYDYTLRCECIVRF